MLATPIARSTRPYFPNKEPDMITHDATTNTWSFEYGRKTYSGYASREQAAEALYDVERGSEPAERQTLTPEQKHAEEPFGTLADGSPMMADTWAGERWGVVNAHDAEGWYATVDDDGCFTLDDPSGHTILHEVYMKDLSSLRTFLASDTLDRMYATAVAWGRGDATPPPWQLEDVVLGTIDNCEVLGSYNDEAPHELCSASVVWQGLKVSTDGRSYINIPCHKEACFGGDIAIDGWAGVQALAQTNVVGQLVALARTHQWPPIPTRAAVQVEQWQGEEGQVYTDFIIGDGLTKVLAGTYGGGKPGVDLVIGGNSINTNLEAVITLADLRQLRDHLTTLLNDPRLAGVFEPQAA